MADHLKSSFAIIRFNSRTYESGGVMAVLKAHSAAEHLMRDYEFGQSEEDRYNGTMSTEVRLPSGLRTAANFSTI